MLALDATTASPDCVDCDRRGAVYTLTCRRCFARLLAREPKTVHDFRIKKLRRHLPLPEFRALLEMIDTERDADALGIVPTIAHNKPPGEA